jgi:PIN domain nuclease of toxin-antitoxin system
VGGERVDGVALAGHADVAESAQLAAGFHKDPADQLIVATARCHGLRLLTADERIRKWGKVAVV